MGRPKAGLVVGGRRLIDHAIALLEACGAADILILGEVEGMASLPDPTPFPGPAAAILAALRSRPGPFSWLVVPVDMPGLEPADVHPLLARGTTSHYERAGFPLVIHPTSLEALPDDPMKDASMRELRERLGSRPLAIPEARQPWFRDCDTPEDLKALEHLLAS